MDVKLSVLVLLCVRLSAAKPNHVNFTSVGRSDRPPVDGCYLEAQAEWEYLRREAQKKLDIIKRKIEENSKDSQATFANADDTEDIPNDNHEIVKRDDYGHGHDKVVVRCKNSYTGEVTMVTSLVGGYL